MVIFVLFGTCVDECGDKQLVVIFTLASCALGQGGWVCTKKLRLVSMRMSEPDDGIYRRHFGSRQLSSL